MISRICKFCRCTERQPCVSSFANGEQVMCSWVDSERTVCSTCVGKLNDEELSAIAEPQLMQMANLEVPYVMPMGALPMLSDCLKLVLRHPQIAANEPDVCKFCQTIIQAIDEQFVDLPVVQEWLKRFGGGMPTGKPHTFDAEAKPPTLLILP